MSQESILFSGFIGALLGATIVGFVNLQINHSRREEDKAKREEDKRKEASKAFLDESILLLERAYETFTRCGTDPPRNDRMLWLSTARMIIRFRKMRDRLTEPAHQDVSDEHEEYWRFRFYSLLLENSKNFTTTYFLAGGQDMSVIDRTSISVVFNFAEWRKGVSDPLDTVKVRELISTEWLFLLQEFQGVRDFLEQDQEHWAEVMRGLKR
jgi:hypothetical protein